MMIIRPREAELPGGSCIAGGVLLTISLPGRQSAMYIRRSPVLFLDKPCGGEYSLDETLLRKETKKRLPRNCLSRYLMGQRMVLRRGRKERGLPCLRRKVVWKHFTWESCLA